MLLADFLSLQAILPALAALLASAMAIHSLVQPSMTYGRKILCGVYVLLTLLITAGLVFYGATQHEEAREQAAAANDVNNKLDRLRALMGNNPNLSGLQVLQGIINQFSKPFDLSDAQISRLSDELFIVKPEMPTIIALTVVPNDPYSASFYSIFSNALTRSTIGYRFLGSQTPSSPSETGVMFSVLDQTNPPPIVLKLQRIFDLANIDTTVVNAGKEYIGEGGFNIFIGPKPL
jgi:hypothetical protein